MKPNRNKFFTFRCLWFPSSSAADVFLCGSTTVNHGFYLFLSPFHYHLTIMSRNTVFCTTSCCRNICCFFVSHHLPFPIYLEPRVFFVTCYIGLPGSQRFQIFTQMLNVRYIYLHENSPKLPSFVGKYTIHVSPLG